MNNFWVFGDIHGMYDPLVKLIETIYIYEAKGEVPKSDKFIFLGDYIDHGPNTKEVLDLLLSIKDKEVVFLAGNHEDLMLHFLYDTEFYRRESRSWFVNGAVETLKSFYRDDLALKVEMENRYEELMKDFEANTEHHLFFRELVRGLDRKYLDFFDNLIYGHKEIIKYKEFQFPLIFLHAGYMPMKHRFIDEKFDLTPEDIEEQAKPRKFKEFNEFWKSLGIIIIDNSVWIRDLYHKKIGDYLLIHGHTPVFYYDKKLLPSEEHMTLPYFHKLEDKYNDNDDIYDWFGSVRAKKLISINLDTGAVYGKALSAMQFGDFSVGENEVNFIQVQVFKGYRRTKPLHMNLRLQFL